MRGTFYGVGVGPGDPELLTLKAVRVLREVDTIFAPAGVGGEGGVALEILRPLGLPPGKFRPVAVPMGRDREIVRTAYRQIATDVVRELEAGLSAAWVTEGDPTFYSTFLHLRDEVAALAPGVRTEVVPGVTSVCAAAARAGMPVARLGDAVAVLPAAYGIDTLPDALGRFATVALMKVNTAVDPLLDRLKTFPGPLRAVYAERVGMPGERVVTDLELLRGARLPYFSLVLLRRGGDGDA